MRIKLKLEVTEGSEFGEMTRFIEFEITEGTQLIPEPQYSVKPGKKRYRKIFGRRKLFPSRVHIQTGGKTTFSSTPMTIVGIEVMK